MVADIDLTPQVPRAACAACGTRTTLIDGLCGSCFNG